MLCRNPNPKLGATTTERSKVHGLLTISSENPKNFAALLLILLLGHLDDLIRTVYICDDRPDSR